MRTHAVRADRSWVKRMAGLAMFLLVVATPLGAQSEAEAPEFVERLREAVEQLHSIRLAVREHAERTANLQREIEALEGTDREHAQRELERLKTKIPELEQSFETLAIGGVDLSVFAEQPKDDFDWRAELVQITRPVLNSLKQLTEKPRRIEELRALLDHYDQQLDAIDKAMLSVTALEQLAPPPVVAEGLGELAAEWRQRRREVERARDIARYQLGNLQGQRVELLHGVRKVLSDFAKGRGLTLLLAVVTGAIVWAALRLVPLVYRAFVLHGRVRSPATWGRALLYGYRLATALIVVLAVLAVFYARGDLLLLLLTVFALVMLALGARQYAPRYVAEVRLLMNVGSVREGERVLYNGVPFQVGPITMYPELRNPELEGTVRLPLSGLQGLVSRPVGEEPWFPCRAGEYLLLPDGRVGEVLQQTVETVTLKARGSVVQLGTAELLRLGFSNLSREGYGIPITFGVDYRHQSIALDVVPARFHAALIEAFGRAGLGGALRELLVELKEAGASSLDYLVYVTMGGEAADAYFAVGRLVQQTCVDVCNREGWGIPFAQLTIHQADVSNA